MSARALRGRLRDRAGLTLVELLVALLIAALIVTAAMDFVRQQGDALRLGQNLMNVTQNYRFAMNTLGRELRTLGAGTEAGQPLLVFASADAIAFNADLVASVPTLTAVYVEPDAPTAATGILPRARRITMPGSSWTYPDTTYPNPAGLPGEAETIVFSFEADATTARTDDFVLMRRVNDQTPTVVARNLLRNGTRPFFEYLRIGADANGTSRLETVPAGSLPLRHTAALHGGEADVGPAAAIDAVRAVRISVTATNGRTGAREERRSAVRVVQMPNAGIIKLSSCGEVPQLGTSLGATIVTSNGQRAVRLSWGRATDESAGERDVLRYVLFKRPAAATEWGPPFLSLPAGAPSYAHVDEAVEVGQSYSYTLAAQDCTPALSAASSTVTVTVTP